MALFGVVSFCLSVARVERRGRSLSLTLQETRVLVSPPAPPPPASLDALCTGRAAPNGGGQRTVADRAGTEALRQVRPRADWPGMRTDPQKSRFWPLRQERAQLPQAMPGCFGGACANAGVGLAHECDGPCAADRSSGRLPAPASPRRAEPHPQLSSLGSDRCRVDSFSSKASGSLAATLTLRCL